ncbi:MAG: 4-(cytidine 5'-diphospho)-2-C-methyl-D-erythritol kinase [Candidatus Omnitrophica bacterium]|nr:4-(cytidine 5'-diphospho)-2-C-methyl-D-erythritol kinase [Candidatus Omnitrophota bacterium]MBD3269024.1 4-(cytidine 5'-diphospho)-2-C-methyl-D-erythritol kinase [Candidatus Omnitrophota bacterium]
MASPLKVLSKKSRKNYGNRIKLISPAKLNLYLNILGKRDDGFHDIESITERISLFDEIDIELLSEDELRFSCNLKSLESSSNLCLKAAELLRNRFNIKKGIGLHLQKNIPVGSGLGGGSSNAATVLLGLNDLLELGLGGEELYSLGSFLGSDVNFFLSQSRFAVLKGRGEEVIPLELSRSLRHIVIWPGIPVSTKVVYDNCRAKLTKFFNNVNILKYALKKGDISLVQRCVFNALEKSAFGVYGELKVAAGLIEKTGLFSLLTGSGGAFFTIDNVSYSKARKLLPHNWFVFEVQTF